MKKKIYKKDDILKNPRLNYLHQRNSYSIFINPISVQLSGECLNNVAEELNEEYLVNFLETEQNQSFAGKEKKLSQHQLNFYYLHRKYLKLLICQSMERPYQLLQTYQQRKCKLGRLFFVKLLKLDVKTLPNQFSSGIQVIQLSTESHKIYVMKRAFVEVPVSNSQNPIIYEWEEQFIEDNFNEYTLMKLYNASCPYSPIPVDFQIILLPKVNFLCTELFMEYAGSPIIPNPNLKEDFILDILIQGMEAIRCLECQRIEQNDIKLGNILIEVVNSKNMLRIIDFDIGNNQSFTLKEGMGTGLRGVSDFFAAPEVKLSFPNQRMRKDINPWKAQIYSFGALLLLSYSDFFVLNEALYKNFDNYKIDPVSYLNFLETFKKYILNEKNLLKFLIYQIILICLQYYPENRLTASELTPIVKELHLKTLKDLQNDLDNIYNTRPKAIEDLKVKETEKYKVECSNYQKTIQNLEFAKNKLENDLNIQGINFNTEFNIKNLYIKELEENKSKLEKTVKELELAKQTLENKNQNLREDFNIHTTKNGELTSKLQSENEKLEFENLENKIKMQTLSSRNVVNENKLKKSEEENEKLKETEKSLRKKLDNMSKRITKVKQFVNQITIFGQNHYFKEEPKEIKKKTNEINDMKVKKDNKESKEAKEAKENKVIKEVKEVKETKISKEKKEDKTEIQKDVKKESYDIDKLNLNQRKEIDIKAKQNPSKNVVVQQERNEPNNRGKSREALPSNLMAKGNQSKIQNNIIDDSKIKNLKPNIELKEGFQKNYPPTTIVPNNISNASNDYISYQSNKNLNKDPDLNINNIISKLNNNNNKKSGNIEAKNQKQDINSISSKEEKANLQFKEETKKLVKDSKMPRENIDHFNFQKNVLPEEKKLTIKENPALNKESINLIKPTLKDAKEDIAEKTKQKEVKKDYKKNIVENEFLPYKIGNEFLPKKIGNEFLPYKNSFAGKMFGDNKMNETLIVSKNVENVSDPFGKTAPIKNYKIVYNNEYKRYEDSKAKNIDLLKNSNPNLYQINANRDEIKRIEDNVSKINFFNKVQKTTFQGKKEDTGNIKNEFQTVNNMKNNLPQLANNLNQDKNEPKKNEIRNNSGQASTIFGSKNQTSNDKHKN